MKKLKKVSMFFWKEGIKHKFADVNGGIRMAMFNKSDVIVVKRKDGKSNLYSYFGGKLNFSRTY